MLCRCAERAQIIRSAVRAVTQGDASRIEPAARFVVATAAQDAKAIMRRLALASRKP